MVKQWSLKGWAVGVGCGVIAGLGVAALMAADAAEKPAEPGRYELHVWAHQGAATGDIGKHGAYRMDSRTGEIWIINARDEAHKLEFK